MYCMPGIVHYTRSYSKSSSAARRPSRLLHVAEGAPTGGPRRTSCACRASRFWRPGVISRHSFTLSVISWCQSTDLMEYIKMDQVPFSFMKVEPSHDGPDYSRLTEPEPSPSSGSGGADENALVLATWTKVRVVMPSPSEQPHYAWESPFCSLVRSWQASMAASS